MISNTKLGLRQFAASYGADTYGCGQYDRGGTCRQTTSEEKGPLAPDTGFLGQPPYVVLPALLLLAVLIGSLTFLIARKLRRR